MKKLLLTFLLVLSICTYAHATEVTTASAHYLQGGITMFKLTSVGDGETFTYDGPIKGWWVCPTDTTDTNSMSVSQSVSGSTNTFTFNLQSLAAGTNTANLFIAR